RLHEALLLLRRRDRAAALVELADDRPLELLGELHLDAHDRLEDGGSRAAVRKAISDESTGCEAPSLITQRTPTMGNPMSGPFFMASLNPLSQAEMNSR